MSTTEASGFHGFFVPFDNEPKSLASFWQNEIRHCNPIRFFIVLPRVLFDGFLFPLLDFRILFQTHGKIGVRANHEVN